MLKRAGRAPFVQRMIGNALAGYLQMVRSTSTFVLDPPDFFDAIRPDLPVICAMWHGQHFLLPFARPPGHEARAMISKSADGEINAIAVPPAPAQGLPWMWSKPPVEVKVENP